MFYIMSAFISQILPLIIIFFDFSWHVIYLGSNSNIVFLEKNDEKWIEKLSDIPQKWFMEISKKQCFLKDEKNLNNLKIECRILDYCREKEKSLLIKSENLIIIVINRVCKLMHLHVFIAT